MRFSSLVYFTCLFMVLVGFAAMVEAAPITYIESGFASGTIGGSNFTNALIEVRASGDTTNVVSFTDGVITVYANLSSLTTVTIAGIGTATVSDANAVYSFPTAVDIDPTHGFPILPYVVIATLDSPPALDSFTGIGAEGNNALLGYDLKTAIGPITGSPGGIGYPTLLTVHTSKGNLSFTANISPTNQGTFTATLVPEPMSLLLLGSGIALLAGISRFRVRS
jgi:hypothetical protein